MASRPRGRPDAREGEQLGAGIQPRAGAARLGRRAGAHKDQDVKDDRDISRTYKLLDHEARDGVAC